MSGPTPQVPDEELLRRIVLSPDPIVTAGEITDQVEMTQAAVNKRLQNLVDDGYIDSRKVGAAARVYWITEKGREQISR